MQYRKTETPQQIIMLESENYYFQLAATPEEIDGAMNVAKANATAVMNEFKQFDSQFLGSGHLHWNTVELH